MPTKKIKRSKKPIFELACHINMFYYFNKIVSHVNIFYSSLNDKDYVDSRMKG